MLLSQVMRAAAITGRTDVVGTRILGRQGGRWTQQWVDGALPQTAAHTTRLRELEDLHRRGILTDDELRRLRER